MKTDFDILIIGGGPAGLSAAMSLGRLGLSALICDDGKPRNAPSSHVNNFPTRDGIHPAEWRKAAMRDLEKYPSIQILEASVLSVEKLGPLFSAQLSEGKTVAIKKVILAYGIKDRMLPIAGFQELWGKAIYHCPFCHATEARGKALGFLVTGEIAFHQLPFVQHLAENLMIFTNGKNPFDGAQMEILRKKKIEVIEEKVVALDYDGKVLKGVRLESGRLIPREGLFVSPIFPLELKSKIGESLGCEKTELGIYKVDMRNATSVPGVFACGDNITMAHSVLNAASTGSMAGAQAAHEILREALESV